MQRILFDRPEIPGLGRKFVVVEGSRIAYIGDARPEGAFTRIVGGSGRLLIPGLYNCHTHLPMTLFRGYGEDLPLDRWLNDRIWPAEELLTDESVYNATLFTLAESLKNGIVSVSDMYFFCDSIARAVCDAGIKANISRSVLSFDPNADMSQDERIRESADLYEKWNGAQDGRIRIELSLHAEYTNTMNSARYVAAMAKDLHTGLHIHLSETKKEHEECIARHGMTPAAFFAAAGAFDVPVNAAHCVWVTDEDIALMSEKGVSVSHNPASNLKLGSGIMPLDRLLGAGVNVALGTDSNASNNTQDILKELYLAALLTKGTTGLPDRIRGEQLVKLATENGAKLQGRADCGRIEAGCRADLTVLETGTLNTFPVYDPVFTLLYSANSSNVKMTMVDGEILYDDGEFPKMDIERVCYNMRCTCANYFKKEQ